MTALTLDTYRLLGRSGLRVSPLGLGTMTFGTEWGWGAERDEARRIFDAYVDLGGNFIDTANMYTKGTSERLVGEFATRCRDRLVIATKYTVATHPGDPNSGGNHRKCMVRSVEGSLRRLRTDYVDLLYLHAWDGTTPYDEVMRAMDDLVRAGKVLYLGISNTPAWHISRMQTIAELRGWSPLIALQLEYNLIQRTVEHELVPMARALGLGVVAWSPLASGVLTNKYAPGDLSNRLASDLFGTRKGMATVSGALTARGLAIADVVRQVATDMERSPAQVALAWCLGSPNVVAPLIGVRSLAQLEDNLGALDVMLNSAQRALLDDVSAVDPGFPHGFLANPNIRRGMFGGAQILPRS